MLILLMEMVIGGVAQHLMVMEKFNLLKQYLGEMLDHNSLEVQFNFHTRVCNAHNNFSLETY